MTRDELIARLDEIAETMTGDPERAHSEADDALLAYVDDDVRAAYQRIVDACNWWACA